MGVLPTAPPLRGEGLEENSIFLLFPITCLSLPSRAESAASYAVVWSQEKVLLEMGVLDAEK